MRSIFLKLKQIKFPLITAFLGVLICAGVIWFEGHIEQGYHTIRWFYPDGTSGSMEFGLQHFNLWGDAVWPGLCFLTGLGIFITAIVQLVKILKQSRASNVYHNFSIVYIVLGIVFIGILLWYLGWLEPSWQSSKSFVVPKGEEQILYRDPHWIRELLAWKICSFVLGAAVIGLGIIQLGLARRKSDETTT